MGLVIIVVLGSMSFVEFEIMRLNYSCFKSLVLSEFSYTGMVPMSTTILMPSVVCGFCYE
jgi:hypothetical protein